VSGSALSQYDDLSHVTFVLPSPPSCSPSSPGAPSTRMRIRTKWPPQSDGNGPPVGGRVAVDARVGSAPEDHLLIDGMRVVWHGPLALTIGSLAASGRAGAPRSAVGPPGPLLVPAEVIQPSGHLVHGGDRLRNAFQRGTGSAPRGPGPVRSGEQRRRGWPIRTYGCAPRRKSSVPGRLLCATSLGMRRPHFHIDLGIELS
jgi:hypothetical protein